MAALECFRFDLDCPTKLTPESMPCGGDGVFYESLIGKVQTDGFRVNRITLENGRVCSKRGRRSTVSLKESSKVSQTVI